MRYVLLENLQTDPLESRFGKYRQLAGSQYNICVRHLYEGEKKLRIQSLMSLKSTCFGSIKIDTFYDFMMTIPCLKKYHAIQVSSNQIGLTSTLLFLNKISKV